MSKPAPKAFSSKGSLVTPRQTEQELREKVKELESEVKSLKTKLDDLRKAKNTTLIKREKEFVSTGIPHTASNESSTQNANLKEKEDMKAKYEKEIEQLKKSLSDMKLKKPTEVKAIDCEHEEIIMALQSRLSETESINTALTMQCEQLQDKLTQSYDAMSQREAEHCSDQERMKTELQKKWQEMYKEWMETTEAKIHELQAANDMLKRMLGNQRP